MRHDKIFLTATSVALANELPIDQAVDAGLVTGPQATAAGQVAIRAASPRRRCASFADKATLDAYTNGNVRQSEIGPIYRINTAFAGDRTASVTKHTATPDRRHPTYSIANGDQGVIDGLTSAALYLSQPQATGATHAVIQAGEIWEPRYRRVAHEYAPLGDGGGALVLSTKPTATVLLATSINMMLVATSTRSLAALGELRRQHASPWPAGFGEHLTLALSQVLTDVLDDASIGLSDVDYLVTPFGTNRPEHALGLAGGKVNEHELALHVYQGRHLGHLGAADLIAGLHRLRRPDTPVRRGDRILLLADSGGASVGAALFERV